MSYVYDALNRRVRGTDELRRGVAAFLGSYGDVHYTDLVVMLAGTKVVTLRSA